MQSCSSGQLSNGILVWLSGHGDPTAELLILSGGRLFLEAWVCTSSLASFLQWGWLVAGGHCLHVSLPIEAFLDICATSSCVVHVSLLSFHWPWTWPSVFHIFQPYLAKVHVHLLVSKCFCLFHAHSCGAHFFLLSQCKLICWGSSIMEVSRLWKWNSWISAKWGSFIWR